MSRVDIKVEQPHVDVSGRSKLQLNPDTLPSCHLTPHPTPTAIPLYSPHEPHPILCTPPLPTALYSSYLTYLYSPHVHLIPPLSHSTLFTTCSTSTPVNSRHIEVCFTKVGAILTQCMYNRDCISSIKYRCTLSLMWKLLCAFDSVSVGCEEVCHSPFLSSSLLYPLPSPASNIASCLLPESLHNPRPSTGSAGAGGSGRQASDC